MHKESYLAITIISAIILALASYGAFLGVEPPWLAVVAIVLTFPVGTLALFLWWNASDKEGDIPFTGY